VRGNRRYFIAGGLAVALGLAIFLSPWASSAPDGLEKVSIDRGFAETATDHDLSDSPLAEYGVRGVENERLGTALAGLIGTLVTFGVGMLVFGFVKGRRAPPGATGL
jgi:hypothetical protein